MFKVQTREIVWQTIDLTICCSIASKWIANIILATVAVMQITVFGAHDEQKQIDKMRELYDLLPIKPEWLTREQIDEYAAKMGAH